MEFSNKSLVILAVGVLALSIFGTSLSLNLIDGMSTVGFASNTANGDVNLSINSTVSIKMNDSLIDFGQCNIYESVVTFNSSSNITNANLSNCTNAALFPDYLIVENDGNINANVTVSIDETPDTLYGDAGSATLAFMTEGEPSNNGCGVADDQPWSSMSASTPYNACTNLSYTGGDQVRMAVSITLPDTATSAADTTMTLTFTASAAS